MAVKRLFQTETINAWNISKEHKSEAAIPLAPLKSSNHAQEKVKS